MKKFVEFLDELMELNKKAALVIQSGNGNHLYLTERFDGYDDYGDSIELYNYDNDMSLLIKKDSVALCRNGEFEIGLGDATLFMSTAEVI